MPYVRSDTDMIAFMRTMSQVLYRAFLHNADNKSIADNIHSIASFVTDPDDFPVIEIFRRLESIATSLERIADSLSQETQGAKHE